MEGQKEKKKSLWMTVLLIGLVFAIVALMAGIIILNVIRNNSEKNDGESGEVDTTGQFNAEQIQSVIEETDRALSAAKTDEEKSSIYTYRAGQLFNLSYGGGGYIEKILADAYKAEELAPTAYTAYYIYVYENSFGNNEKAEEYLRIAQSRGFIDGNGEG